MAGQPTNDHVPKTSLTILKWFGSWIVSGPTWSTRLRELNDQPGAAGPPKKAIISKTVTSQVE